MNNRRLHIILTFVFATAGSASGAVAQAHTSEFPAPQAPPQQNRTIPANDNPAVPVTQAAGSFIYNAPSANTLNSLTGATSLKARVNYMTGSLTAGEFVVHLRAGQVL